MFRPRVIPTLLLEHNQLVKTVKFKSPTYVGDPVNAIKVFNDKWVDEIVVLDITATKEGRKPDIDFISNMCGEAFMPFSYGGGISTVEEIKKLIKGGVEKVVLNASIQKDLSLVVDAAKEIGSQSIVACIDIKSNWLGKQMVYCHQTGKSQDLDLDRYIEALQNAGCGEIILQSVDLDGTMKGYDLKLIEKVSKVCTVPLVVLGGVGNFSHLEEGIESGASAVSAGSFFVFHGKHKAVLITYPTQQELAKLNP